MSTPIQYPYTGGNRHSSASAELKIAIPGGATFIYAGWSKIEYKWSIKPEKVHGHHPDPIGQTLGESEYTASWEVYLAEYLFLLGQLGPGFATIPFTFTVAYSENGFDTMVDTILGCRLVGGQQSASKGPAPLTVPLDLSPLKILPNGVDMLAIPLTAAAA